MIGLKQVGIVAAASAVSGTLMAGIFYGGAVLRHVDPRLAAIVGAVYGVAFALLTLGSNEANANKDKAVQEFRYHVTAIAVNSVAIVAAYHIGLIGTVGLVALAAINAFVLGMAGFCYHNYLALKTQPTMDVLMMDVLTRDRMLASRPLSSFSWKG